MGIWGIVAGLVAMVATVFVSFAILNSKVKGSPKVPNGKIDEPREAVTRASTDHRRAA
jgi:hypothetical protein